MKAHFAPDCIFILFKTNFTVCFWNHSAPVMWDVFCFIKRCMDRSGGSRCALRVDFYSNSPSRPQDVINTLPIFTMDHMCLSRLSVRPQNSKLKPIIVFMNFNVTFEYSGTRAHPYYKCVDNTQINCVLKDIFSASPHCTAHPQAEWCFCAEVVWAAESPYKKTHNNQ